MFNSWVLLYDNNFTGWMSAVTTGGSANFTIPATGRPGLHLIELLHGEFTFPYACAFNSQGDVELIMKATGEPGWHFIDLYPGIYKGSETRPNNFRIPQLTHAADHPGKDLPAFRFAFEVTPAD